MTKLNLPKVTAVLIPQQRAIDFAEWVADNYSKVYSDELKISKFVSLDAPIYIHGSDSYRTQLVHTHGKTTKELYEIFKALNG